MIVYKLTDQKMQTHGGCQWEIGVPIETDGSGDLCGPGWLHYMTLRDWFAGQALAGLMPVCQHDTIAPGTWPQHIARNAYEVADAMLAARDAEAGK